MIIDVNKNLIIEKVNARCLKIIPDFSSYKIVSDNDKISELIFSENCHYKVGDFVESEFGRYYIKSIKKSIKSFLLEACELNTTSVFILPLVLKSHVNISENKYIYNSYLSETSIKNNENFVSVILRNENSDEYDLFEKILYENENFKSFEDRNGFTILTFEIPARFVKSFDYYLQGKYSLFSQDAKNRVYSYNANESMSLRQIFDRDKKRRKELLDSLAVKDSEVAYDLELLQKVTKRECIEYLSL